MVIAEHLRVAIEQIPLAVNMGQVSMSASFGASILMAKDSDWRASMNRADKAMYRAKAGGRNRIVGIDAEGEEFDISAIGGRRRG